MEGYVPPKKPYSFLAMIDDILCFAADTLVPDGRLSFWMPTANEDEDGKEFEIPQNPDLELISVCIQPFNKCMTFLPLLSLLFSAFDGSGHQPINPPNHRVSSIAHLPKITHNRGRQG